MAMGIHQFMQIFLGGSAPILTDRLQMAMGNHQLMQIFIWGTAPIDGASSSIT
ncbi:hypothetical protein U1Q18_013521, partial [Sarracenia purpurea var. burkii]